MRRYRQQKKCSRCGDILAFFPETWRQMEVANGKHYPTKHRGCGGEFLATVAQIGRRA